MVPQEQNPTAAPTNSSNNDPLVDGPSRADCDAIRNGDPVDGQEGMLVRNFDLFFDLAMNDDGLQELGNAEVSELEDKFRENILPLLVGCPANNDQRRTLLDNGISMVKPLKTMMIRKRVLNDNAGHAIGDTKIELEYDVDGSCDEEGIDDLDSSCFRVVARLTIYLKNSEGVYLLGIIGNTFGTELLFQNSGLDETKYKNLRLVSVTTLEETGAPSPSPTNAPSMALSNTPSQLVTVDQSKSPTTFPTASPSSNPTTAPVIGPTTEAPTDAPSFVPTQSLSSLPTATPTAIPTKNPSKAPTTPPTVAGSGTPTKTPSSWPSLLPSALPSIVPSGEPSLPPSQSPSLRPSAKPSTFPSFSPSTSEPSFTPSVAPVDLVTSSAVFSQSSYRITSGGTVPMIAEKANDGNTYNYSNCFRSRNGSCQWWRVDLGLTGTVTSVTIWNYTSNSSVRGYITGSLVELLDSDENVLSTSTITIGGSGDPRDQTFTFPGGVADVASVKITKTSSEGDLYVCEAHIEGYIQ